MPGVPMPPDTTVIPSLLGTLIHDYSVKLLTVLATSLVGYGLLPGSQTTQFASIGAGIVVGAASIAWTYIAARIRNARLKAAVSAPSSVPVTQ